MIILHLNTARPFCKMATSFKNSTSHVWDVYGFFNKLKNLILHRKISQIYVFLYAFVFELFLERLSLFQNCRNSLLYTHTHSFSTSVFFLFVNRNFKQPLGIYIIQRQAFLLSLPFLIDSFFLDRFLNPVLSAL